MLTKFDVTMAARKWKIVIMNKKNFLTVTFGAHFSLLLLVLTSFYSNLKVF